MPCMTKLQFKNKWVLVTGASSGLGAEIARQLAANHGANLILLARRKDKLEQLKSELEGNTGVKVKLLIADLSKPGEVDQALDDILADDQLYAAVLNAAITHFGPHRDLSWTEYETMLQTNVNAVVRMTNRLTTYFENNNHEGGLMIVSSMAALIPIPYQAVYSGTKSFLLGFATALRFELKNKNFSITVFTPGGIETEMTEGEKFNDLRNWLTPVSQVAKDGLNAFEKRKLTHIPGFSNKMGAFLIKLLGRKFILTRMSSIYKSSLLKSEKSK